MDAPVIQNTAPNLVTQWRQQLKPQTVPAASLEEIDRFLGIKKETYWKTKTVLAVAGLYVLALGGRKIPHKNDFLKNVQSASDKVANMYEQAFSVSSKWIKKKYHDVEQYLAKKNNEATPPSPEKQV